MTGNLNEYTTLHPQRGLVHAMLAMAHTHKFSDVVQHLRTLKERKKKGYYYANTNNNLGRNPNYFFVHHITSWLYIHYCCSRNATNKFHQFLQLPLTQGELAICSGKNMYVEFLTKHNYLRQTRMNKELQSTHTSHSPGAPLTLAVPVTVSPTNKLFSLLFRLFAFSVEESGHSHQLHQWSPNLILGEKILRSVPVFSSVQPSNRNRARLGYGGQTQTIRGTMGALPPEEKCLVKVKCRVLGNGARNLTGGLYNSRILGLYIDSKSPFNVLSSRGFESVSELWMDVEC